MKQVPITTKEVEIVALGDEWAALMEAEDYEGAFAFTDHVPEMGWTPAFICQVIKSYDECRPTQKVTVKGISTDVSQRKSVRWWEKNDVEEIGELWYDLNIDGLTSDVTATFRIVERSGMLFLRLNDIHVM